MSNTKKNVSLKWAEACARSKNTMVVLPQEFVERADELEEKVQQLRRLETDLNNFAQNLWYDVRKALDAKKINGALNMDLGWNKDAKEEGIWIINITPPRSNGPMGMQL